MKTSYRWQKILLLHMFGLKTYKEINQQVHRYKLSDVEHLIEDIKFGMQKDVSNNIESVYVVVLVPLQHQFKLPNYIVKTNADLKGIRDFASIKTIDKYKEIWYFVKSNIIDQTCECGRILFTNDPISSQVIEVVNGDSVRDLEKDIANLDMYIMTERVDWGWSYKITKTVFRNDAKKDYYEYRLSLIYKSIENVKERINCLMYFFNSLDLYTFSLDFLFVDNKLQIIDWDTENDKKVLAFLNSRNFDLFTLEENI